MVAHGVLLGKFIELPRLLTRQHERREQGSVRLLRPDIRYGKAQQQDPMEPAGAFERPR